MYSRLLPFYAITTGRVFRYAGCTWIKLTRFHARRVDCIEPCRPIPSLTLVRVRPAR